MASRDVAGAAASGMGVRLGVSLASAVAHAAIASVAGPFCNVMQGLGQWSRAGCRATRRQRDLERSLAQSSGRGTQAAGMGSHVGARRSIRPAKPAVALRRSRWQQCSWRIWVSWVHLTCGEPSTDCGDIMPAAARPYGTDVVTLSAVPAWRV